MRRRKRSNPLLAKTVLIGVGVTVIVLPILAQLGLFKQMHENYVQTELINLPPPPPQPKEAKPKAHKTVHPHVEGHHGARITRATVQVHVQAGTATKSGGDHTNEIVNAPPGAPVGVVPPSPAPVSTQQPSPAVAPVPTVIPPVVTAPSPAPMPAPKPDVPRPPRTRRPPSA